MTHTQNFHASTRGLATVAIATALGATLAAAPTTAEAADLYRPTYNGTVPLSDIERWSGFYMGASLGYGRGATGLSNAFASADVSGSGWLGSVYAGYNWRFGPMIVGLETDIGTGGYQGSRDVAGARYETDLKSIASMRARVGFLATENLLLYGTGGLAMARINTAIEGGGNATDTYKGYQLGFGGEYKFNPNWSLKLEYIYTDFKDNTRAYGGAQTRFDPDFHTVRAGISFKF